MTFFESLLALLLAAIVLLQVARRLRLPYPAMLALSGVLIALIPGAPILSFESDTALPLFLAPVVMDAAFDFPLAALRRIWVHLIVYAFVAVVVTAVCVAFVGVKLIGLPVAAALAMGAIVAPPDAAAATAILRAVSIPRQSDVLLKAESLFNDATALLLFALSLAVLSSGAYTPAVAFRISLAIPGGLLFGYVCALVFHRVQTFIGNTLGGNLLQFVGAYLIWIAAEHIHISAVLSTIAFAMTLARMPQSSNRTRMRVQSYAVWSAVVFSLNVFAFLLMGLQGRTIIARMPEGNLHESFLFAGIVVAAVIIVRLIIVMSFDRINTWWQSRRGRSTDGSWRLALLEGWTGMRGFISLATALALPDDFPQRDLVVLTAFFVILATLVLQGLTLIPLVRLLKLDQGDVMEQEVSTGRCRLASAALSNLETRTGAEADLVRASYTIQRYSTKVPDGVAASNKRRELGLAAIQAQRAELERMLAGDVISADSYLLLQEEIDWSELVLLCDKDRRIEEG